MLEAADSAAFVMASTISMQCSSWLQLAGLPREMQQTIQDLPFEKTDERLHSLKDLRATLGNLYAGSEEQAVLPAAIRVVPPFIPHSQDLLRRRLEIIRDGLYLLPPLQLPVHRDKTDHQSNHFDLLVESSLSLTRVPSFPFPGFANHLSHFLSAWSPVTSGS